ncbi:MAG: C40 family peptidase [Hyphomonadaceae bacterium]
MTKDPRLTPARGDLAAAHLRGEIEAARYVEGVAKQVVAPVAPLHEKPNPNSRLETQLLFGETFLALDEADGFLWGQCERDLYVGYAPANAFMAPPIAPTHRVSALRTIVFSAPEVKSAPLHFLSLNAKVACEAQTGAFARIARGGFVFAAHLAPLDARAPDFVAVAEQFLGAPYLWGGKDSLGLDCSGLIQSSLEAAGIFAPRDSDMQEEALGAPLRIAPDLSGLQRGDLVFWDGHVGMMLDAARLIHANAYHMKVEIEPLREAVARIAPVAGPIRAIKRI